MSKIKVSIILILGIIMSCSTKQERIYPEYYKSVYVDPFNGGSAIMLESDSFILVNYRIHFHAQISKGIVENKKGYKILSPKELISVSLNTGQTMEYIGKVDSIYYKWVETDGNEFQLKKYLDNNIDTSFRNGVYKLTNEISDLEKRLFDRDLPPPRNHSVRNNTKIILPLSELSDYDRELRDEVKKLNKERQGKIRKLISGITTKCNINGSDSIIFRIDIIPDGKIESYDLVKFSKSSISKVGCVKSMLSEPIDLGEMKIIQSARQGTEARTMRYTLPIK